LAGTASGRRRGRERGSAIPVIVGRVNIVNPGDTFSFTFAAPGTYSYYCQIHGGPGGQGMAGTVVIGG
jgi:plastocyanin